MNVNTNIPPLQMIVTDKYELWTYELWSRGQLLLTSFEPFTTLDLELYVQDVCFKSLIGIDGVYNVLKYGEQFKKG